MQENKKTDIDLLYNQSHDFNEKMNFEKDLDDYYNFQNRDSLIDESKILCYNHDFAFIKFILLDEIICLHDFVRSSLIETLFEIFVRSSNFAYKRKTF